MTINNNNLPYMCLYVKNLQQKAAKMDGVVMDADTILQDMIDDAESEVSGTGLEVIDIYLKSSDKEAVAKMFEAFTGVSFAEFIEQCINTLRETTKTEGPITLHPTEEPEGSAEAQQKPSVMTDKERILTSLFQSTYMQLLYGMPADLKTIKDMQPGMITGRNPLMEGDLVCAMTSIEPNPFVVGWVEQVFSPNDILIRELGGEAVCRYSNEQWMRIDKEKFSTRVLEGAQYQAYQLVLEAFREAAHGYTFRFAGIDFSDNLCTVSVRKVMEDGIVFTFDFDYTENVTVHDVTATLDMMVDAYKKGHKTKPVINTCLKDDGTLVIYVGMQILAEVADGRQDEEFIADTLDGMGYIWNEDGTITAKE